MYLFKTLINQEHWLRTFYLLKWPQAQLTRWKTLGVEWIWIFLKLRTSTCKSSAVQWGRFSFWAMSRNERSGNSFLLFDTLSTSFYHHKLMWMTFAYVLLQLWMNLSTPFPTNGILWIELALIKVHWHRVFVPGWILYTLSVYCCLIWNVGEKVAQLWY